VRRVIAVKKGRSGEVKKMLLLSVLVGSMIGCGKEETKTPVVQLNQTEIELVESNPNIGAQLLVKKAILKEMEGNVYNEEQQKLLKEMKENLELEFYLSSISQDNIVVTDGEILKVYQDNAKVLKDRDIVEVFPQLKQQLINQRLGAAKINTINKIVEKYKLNDVLKSYTKKNTSKKLVKEVSKKVVDKTTIQTVPSKKTEK
jgi:molybdopterin converting factor small subunit